MITTSGGTSGFWSRSGKRNRGGSSGRASGLRCTRSANSGYGRKPPDDELWRLCQREQIILLTANRNLSDSTSLEAVIRAENRPDCLPVFTVADADRVFESRDYVTRVAEKLLEYLLYIDNVRGTGRLFLP